MKASELAHGLAGPRYPKDGVWPARKFVRQVKWGDFWWDLYDPAASPPSRQKWLLQRFDEDGDIRQVDLDHAPSL